MRTLRAFTLVEILVVLAIVSFIVAAITDLLLHYNSTLTLQQATIDVDMSANQVVYEVEQAALQASAISASHTFGSATYYSGSSALVLQVPSIDSSGNIISGSNDYIAFFATSTTNAYEVVDAAVGSSRGDTTRLLSDVLSTLTFTYGTTTPANATSTTVDVVTSTMVGTTTISRHLDEQVYLRNI